MTATLVIQTAFAGDLILTLPLVQEMRRLYPETRIDLLCIPGTAPLLAHHPAVNSIIAYDKHAGRPSLTSLAGTLRGNSYDLVISPHRSLRSALLARASGARRRVSFDRSAGAWLYTDRVAYDAGVHEVVRNLRLLKALHGDVRFDTAPRLYPGPEDRASARVLISQFGDIPYVCLAPGSVWATKRWTTKGFSTVARELGGEYGVLLVGGKSDHALCEEVRVRSGSARVVNAAGRFSFLASAAAIEGAAVLVSNDSAPVHIASAMGTPVVEIYGATVPEFGFSPFGVPYRIAQLDGLDCRPCAIHGGKECPVGTFACMRELRAEDVLAAASALLGAQPEPR